MVFDLLPTLKAEPTCYIHNAPPEIVIQFFRLYLDTLGKHKVRKGLLTLCLTCERWRDIAVSVPSFWTSFEISVSSTSSVTLNTLDTFLKRSCQCSLTFSFNVQVGGPFIASGDTKIACAILRKLVLHVHRWYKVIFAFQLDEPPSFPENATAELLESLDIQMESCADQQLRWITSLLNISPRLRAFVDRAPCQTIIQALSLSNLRHIQLTCYQSPDQAFRILEQMPILDYCQLSLKEDDTQDSILLPRVVCQARSMTVNFASNENSRASFFTRLIAPNLVELELHPLHGPLGPIDWQSLQTFLTRTPGQITSFTIRNLFMKDEELLDLLRPLSPSLKRLLILTDSPCTVGGYRRVENFTARVIAPLTYRREFSSDEFICPKLEILGLERCVCAEDGLINNMVSSRRPHPEVVSTSCTSVVAELKVFYVVLRSSGHSVDGERLAKLRQEGLSGIVEFGYPRREWIHGII